MSNTIADLGYQALNARAKRKEEIIWEIVKEFPNACPEHLREAITGECNDNE